MSKTVGYFPVARLPGVVRQNMADFRSNPLGWDTVQLSSRVCPEKEHERRIKRSCSAGALDGGIPQLVSFVFKCSLKNATVAVERGETEPVPALPLLLPRCQSSFPRFSSCIFITKAVHSSTGWVTSASHRLTGEGGECHVKQTPHKYSRPNLWNGCL